MIGQQNRDKRAKIFDLGAIKSAVTCRPDHNPGGGGIVVGPGQGLCANELPLMLIRVGPDPAQPSSGAVGEGKGRGGGGGERDAMSRQRVLFVPRGQA